MYFAWVNQRRCPFCIESTGWNIKGQFCISHVPSHTLKSDGYPELPIVAEMVHTALQKIVVRLLRADLIV